MSTRYCSGMLLNAMDSLPVLMVKYDPPSTKSNPEGEGFVPVESSLTRTLDIKSSLPLLISM